MEVYGLSSCALMMALVCLPLAHAQAQDERSSGSPQGRVAITAAIKAKFSAEYVRSLRQVEVSTDRHGVVSLRGRVRSHEASTRADVLARDTEGVTQVQNHIRIRSID